jgi:hypothetical protein
MRSHLNEAAPECGLHDAPLFLKAGQLAELNDAQRPKRIDLVRIQV